MGGVCHLSLPTAPGLGRFWGPRPPRGSDGSFHISTSWGSVGGSESSQGTPLPAAASACLSGHQACGYREGASGLPFGQAPGPTPDRAPLTSPAAGLLGAQGPPPLLLTVLAALTLTEGGPHEGEAGEEPEKGHVAAVRDM